MKLIEDKKKTEVILDEKEKVEISSLQGHIKIIVTCLGNTLHIEEITKDGKIIEDEETKAIKAMQNYLKVHKDDK